MPMTGISSGRDIQLTISDNVQGIIATTNLKEYNCNQKVDKRESRGLDGVNKHANFPGGWDGNMMFERTSSAIDDYIANVEKLYYSGQNIPIITMLVQIREANGNITQYQHQGVVFHYSDAGNFKGDDFVTQKIDFSAQNRIKLA